MATEVSFKNSNGDVISTSNPTAINDYRTRDGFEEVKSSTKKADQADDKSSTKKADQADDKSSTKKADQADDKSSTKKADQADDKKS